MRIAHVSATFPPYYGGTGNVCYLNALALARRGHEVHVFTSAHHGAPATETVEDMVIHRLRPLIRFGNASLLPGLLAAWRGFDIVHLHAPFISGAELTVVGSRLSRIPVVVTYHNDFVRSGGLRDLVFSLSTWSMRQLVLPAAQRILFVSQGHAETNDMRSLLDRIADRCEVFPNGVETSLFRPADGGAARQALGIPMDSAVIGFVGGLDSAHHYKGLEMLIDALASGELDDVYLLVAGDGNLRAGMESRARVAGLGERASFVGAVPYEKLPPLYQACDVVALPSQAAEAFPLVIIEALSCGVPVVAADWPGVRSVLRHGETGLLVHPGESHDLVDALRHLLDHPESRKRMGTTGRQEIVERYSWTTLGHRLEHLYLATRADHRGGQRITVAD